MPRVIQITDVHLHHDPQYFHPGDKPDRRMQAMRSEDGRERAGNVNVRAGLELVLEDAARREGPLGPEDLLVVTGDLVQDFRRTTYVLLRDLLLQAAVAAGKPRIRCLAGNHDINEMVRSVFPAPNPAPRTCFAERLGGWLVLGVDTESATSPHQGPGGGGLSAEVLRWLRQQLRSGHRTLLVMHHPPLATINSFMDGERGEGLFDAGDRAALEGIVAQHREQIAGIFCVRASAFSVARAVILHSASCSGAHPPGAQQRGWRRAAVRLAQHDGTDTARRPGVPARLAAAGLPSRGAAGREWQRDADTC